MIHGGKVLFIDDDQDFADSVIEGIKKSLSGVTWKIVNSPTQVEAEFLLFNPELCILDLELDPKRGVESGFQALTQIITAVPDQRVIVLTGHGKTELGVRALNQGAANFLRKPPNLGHLAALIKDAITQACIRKELVELRGKQLFDLSQYLVGESFQMTKVRELVLFAASTNQPVLLTGETGTGKGECAIAIHKTSKRRQNKFIRYQPAVASQDLINSDLFGHSKGAYTGATTGKKGLLEEASGGTFFLDEVDEFAPGTQVALLGVLQSKSMRPVGENREVSVDFRLICATNTPIASALESGKLREDFYHRVAHLKIELPPLRERHGDITILARHVLDTLNQRGDVPRLFLSDKTAVLLEHHEWPGNVRELIAVVENAAFRATFEGRSHLVETDVLFVIPQKQKLQKQIFSPEKDSTKSGQVRTFSESVENYKYELIQDALNRVGGNQSKASQLLSLDRTSLRRILKRKT
jgi:DNA-binding NtrC family response regulator